MTTSSSSELDRLTGLRAQHEFLFIVFYRGHWCPFCQAYAKQLLEIRQSIRDAGGECLIVTSENASELPAFRKSTGYDGPASNDPSLSISNDFKNKGWVEVAITEKAGYPNGMTQPAILVLKKDDTVLEKWAIQPSLMNLGGAKDRPDLHQVWSNVEAQLKGDKPVHEEYAKQSFFTGIKQKIWG